MVTVIARFECPYSSCFLNLTQADIDPWMMISDSYRPPSSSLRQALLACRVPRACHCYFPPARLAYHADGLNLNDPSQKLFFDSKELIFGYCDLTNAEEASR